MYSSTILPALCVGLAAAAPAMEQRQAGYAATTTWEFTGNTLPTGLTASTWQVDADKPGLLNHRFDAENVVVQDGAMLLTVPGGQQGQQTISSAEVATFSVLYGSVRVEAQLTEVAGVVNGFFFYESDSQEQDIEFVTDPESFSNKDSPSGGRELQYTNQATQGQEDTMKYGSAPSDITSAIHEYGIDWSPGSTKYYLDGELQYEFTTNVPTEPSAFLINNWVNGDPYWTLGPPKTDAVMKVTKITLAYNP
ncbi:uncharacterized protein LTR77_006332 [Saxophila tyrrhenica]|uniref:GH16 domain-containing protein n=1 Tax=Saxophila tyrrhenica TaxID=1690608 RepID=A0AAV9P8E3_9PEZI|nr:hypothetical protein LTR77_006332 [Saxophila tyrrhenica]